MNKLVKSAVLVSSLAIAGVLIAYQGGYIPISLPGYAQSNAPSSPTTAPSSATAPSQMILGSKSGMIAPTTVENANLPPTLTNEQIMIYSSKSAVITPPKTAPSTTSATTATAPAILIGGSKSRVMAPPPVTAPTSATAPAATAPAVLIGGSKSDVIIVIPPATKESGK